MNSTKSSSKLQNTFLYLVTSLLLYFSLYVLISKQFKGLYNPFFGGVILIFSIFIDFYFSKKRLRIYIRFFIVICSYLLLKFLISIFSLLASPGDGYHLFIDKLPYLFNRDTVIAIIFILFYFIFDATRIIKTNILGYILSTMILILSFFLSLRFDISINKTIFVNYFNLSIFLIFIVGLFIFRHTIFHQNHVVRKFEKRDLLLFLPLLLSIIFLFFSVILPEHIDEKGSGDSGLLDQGLWQFDFSNFVELKDEIKLNNDRVLIMELSGVKDSIRHRINRGWNRQIYLKRFSIEEYERRGRFKMTENFVDPHSPPVYISNYMWELKDKPQYKERINIIETLYLINIDPSSLMGSDLMLKVAPITNWKDSPYKQIYRSYCYVTDTLSSIDLTQENFLKNLHPSRKKMLLNWGDEKGEGKIKKLAEDITSVYKEPIYKALAIQEYLRKNYYYSLKPGLARGGNQLEYFLFDTKKGYCSYYAFAMTLMLRSLGIASRVVVGFAPDMENKTLNFYDIRSLDAHAWVEVFFDDYGWLTFDPTSSNIAEGEEYEFDLGNKEERDDLIEEILKNREKMKEVTKEKEKSGLLEDFTQKLKRSIRWIGVITFFVILLSLIFLLYLRKNINLILYLLTKDSRKKANYLYKDILGSLVDYGYSINEGESILEYAKRIKQYGIADIIRLTETFQRAVFREQKEMDVTVKDLKEMREEIKNDFNKFIFKKKLKAFFNISRLWKRILPIIFVILFSLFSFNMYADEYKSVDDYINESIEAINSNYFDKALEILKEAEEKFPDSYKPNIQKGRLYYYHELYEIALIEFLKVKDKGYITKQIYQYIATSYGSIGEDQKAVEVYEEAFEKLFPSRWLYESLGWMYFKVHNVEKGIEIVEEGLEKEKYPNSSDLYMTLGTLYSSVRDYKRAKRYYLDAIQYSYENYKSNHFRAIVYYNLSLLENSFLYFEDAFNSARASISLQNRSSAHLELNYLYTGALDLKNAYNEILKASRLEPKTLFPEMSLAYIYFLSGRLDEAISETKKLLQNKDFSWMLYFGTNKDAYYSELYRSLSMAYEYKINQINFNDKNNVISSITRPFKKFYYWILSVFYNFKYANLFIKIGEEKIKGGSKLEGLEHLSAAYERIWPAKAMKVLKLSEKIEVGHNPQKQKYYNIRGAIIKKKSSIFFTNNKKKKKLKENLSLLDEKWEKDIKAETILEIIKASRGVEKQKSIEELFLLHSPFLPMNNLKVKMNIRFANQGFSIASKKKIIRILKKRGILSSYSSRLSVEIGKISDDIVFINVYDYNKLLKTSRIKTDDFTKNHFEMLGLEIFNKLFVSELY